MISLSDVRKEFREPGGQVRVIFDGADFAAGGGVTASVEDGTASSAGLEAAANGGDAASTAGREVAATAGVGRRRLRGACLVVGRAADVPTYLVSFVRPPLLASAFRLACSLRLFVPSRAICPGDA